MPPVERACRRLVAECPDGAGAIRGLSFGSQLDGMVVVDGAGAPLRPAMIWMDRRAEAQAAALAEGIAPADFYAAVGANLDSSHAVFKAMWVRDERSRSVEPSDATSCRPAVRAPACRRGPGRRLLERVVVGAPEPADA